MEKISRQRAYQLGYTDYYTGKPCSRGHISERRVKDWRCRECAREDARAYFDGVPKDKMVTIKVRIPREHEAMVREFIKGVRKL